ncbi:DOT1-domain-containing protein [Sanghuangporus baumii]|uniref:Histone-lysine N-methyltransferase, H3 lysine-79 specific n=1 Tax=Sanghuangporus baumii TaxID=108892 RepID=A0A9Q5I578_SANBA|nr:DOT1-domain-containing protein [Sanghuangporus baumii]
MSPSLMSSTSLFRPRYDPTKPEYEKSILEWKGKKSQKSSAPQVPTVKVVVQRSKTLSSQSPPPLRELSSSPPAKRSAPASAVSTSSVSSSVTSLASATTPGESNARLFKKRKLSSASSSPKSPDVTRKRSMSPQSGESAKDDASKLSTLKRERSMGDASPIAGGSKADEDNDASLTSSPPESVKKVKDASTRESALPSSSMSTASIPSTSLSKPPYGPTRPERPKTPSPRPVLLPREPLSTPPKRLAPVSSGSSSSVASSLTSLPSETTSDESDARLPKKNLSSAFSSVKPPDVTQSATIIPKSFGEAKDSSSKLSTLKRARSMGDESSLAEGSEADERDDASLMHSLPKRVKRLKDASTRATTVSSSVSANTSRSSSPAPSGKTSARSRKTSRKSDGSGRKTRRRKKRALTDLTLPPKKGTYNRHLTPIMVRNASTPDSTMDCESDSNLPLHDPRQTWTEEDGNIEDGLRTSEQVVKRLSEMGRYRTFFRNPNDPEDMSYELSKLPTVELEYPNTGAVETFLLARPKDEDHYDPTLDIENTLTTFIKDIIPCEFKDVFGPLPEDALRSIADEDDEDNYRASPTPLETSLHRVSSFLTPETSEPSTLSLVPYSDSESGTPPPPTSSSRCSPSPKGLMRSLITARHRRDGPAYTATLREINQCIREFKKHISGNILREVPRTWEMDGIPVGVVHRIIEETYQRCVGPQINQLRKYEAFSSNVYGELTPAFVDDIIKRTRLNSKSLFLDLGSGVGNVVLQTALQTGCEAFGIEERGDTAQIAIDQFEQIKLRCRMWGVSMGEVELVQGDMTRNVRVDQLMSKADVVLVNNYVFSEELNAALRPKFLDLKEGAFVVSLKPFATPKSQQLTERNFDDISSIFVVKPYPYHSGTRVCEKFPRFEEDEGDEAMMRLSSELGRSCLVISSSSSSSSSLPSHRNFAPSPASYF